MRLRIRSRNYSSSNGKCQTQSASIGLLGHIGRSSGRRMVIEGDRADADRFVDCGRDQGSSCSCVDLLAQDFADPST